MAKRGCEHREECVLYQSKGVYLHFNATPDFCDTVTEQELEKTGVCPIYDTVLETQWEMVTDILSQVHKSSEDQVTQVNKLAADVKKKLG